MTASARGRSNRRKGRATQCDAAKVLSERDWSVVETASGIKTEDMVATDPQGVTHSVEVKNHKLIDLAKFRTQAIEQAHRRKLPWLLMVKISGESGAYLVTGKHKPATVWRRRTG
jgi:Holliday junction resolvase